MPFMVKFRKMQERDYKKEWGRDDRISQYVVVFP